MLNYFERLLNSLSQKKWFGATKRPLPAYKISFDHYLVGRRNWRSNIMGEEACVQISLVHIVSGQTAQVREMWVEVSSPLWLCITVILLRLMLAKPRLHPSLATSTQTVSPGNTSHYGSCTKTPLLPFHCDFSCSRLVQPFGHPFTSSQCFKMNRPCKVFRISLRQIICLH